MPNWAPPSRRVPFPRRARTGRGGKTGGGDCAINTAAPPPPRGGNPGSPHPLCRRRRGWSDDRPTAPVVQRRDNACAEEEDSPPSPSQKQRTAASAEVRLLLQINRINALLPRPVPLISSPSVSCVRDSRTAFPPNYAAKTRGSAAETGLGRRRHHGR